MKKKINIFYIFEKYPRHYYVFAFFLLFFFLIVTKVFSYTIVNYDFYSGLADKQQMGKVSVPVTRGTIYSSNGSGTVLATSVKLNDLAIDPTQEGDKNKLSLYLKDIVYKQTCYLKTSHVCYENLLKFLKKLEIEDYVYEEDYVKGLIFEEVRKRLSKTKVTSVLLAEDLDDEQISILSNYNFSGVYLYSNSLYVNPEELIEADKISLEFSKILPLEKEEIKNLIRKRETRYIAIINKISIGISEEIENYITEESSNVRRGLINKDDSIGNFIILTPNPHRYYPEGSLASQIIGFVDSEGIGHYGLEGYFNDILKGQDSEVFTKKDVNNMIIDPMLFSSNIAISEGSDIYTTIDRNVQKKAESILEKGVKKYNANKGTIIVMDPKTGEIISMANYPAYDPNNPGDVYELEKVTFGKYPDPRIDLLGKVVFIEDNENGDEYYYDGKKVYLRLANREELGDNSLVKYKYKNDFGPGVYRNDAISSLYEPGSIMKSMTVSIGIDSSEITENTMYQDNGELSIDQFHIKNVSDKCLGYNTFAHALNYSCNVGMIRISQRYGQAIAYEYLNSFGFGNKTNITLDGEVSKTIENYEKRSKAKLYTSSYGLGISVTPLQMAVAYSSIANGGLYVTPSVVKQIVTPEGNIIKYKPDVKYRVLEKSTSDNMISILVNSVENGVASNGKIEGYTIAGKTGTAQIAYKGGYEDGVGSTVGSFAGFGPAEDPKFVVIVKLERPRASEYGGSTSAFLFKDMMEYLLDYYGIPGKDVK